ncbi:MAG: (d)CMP kinase [Clostridia bacterium]|nr:(d)CMP kinase [Clostridia bacterium]
MVYNIAIDGPAGAGKSTIARLLAHTLNVAYLDTGAMYRCLGLKVIQHDININDTQQINDLLANTDIRIENNGKRQLIFLDGKDVSTDIRAHAVSNMASEVSANEQVRIAMAQKQREMAALANCVLEGREIGTYVLPNAKYKFFLTASVDIRTQRRFNQLTATGQTVDYNQLRADIILRDTKDATRPVAPLRCAEDAIKIDSSHLTIEQVIELMLTYIKE